LAAFLASTSFSALSTAFASRRKGSTSIHSFRLSEASIFLSALRSNRTTASSVSASNFPVGPKCRSVMVLVGSVAWSGAA
jgi:hypothetical protein